MLLSFPKPWSYNKTFFHSERHAFQPLRATLFDRRSHMLQYTNLRQVGPGCKESPLDGLRKTVLTDEE